MLNKFFLILLSIGMLSFSFSAYSVGQTVSVSDQQMMMDICNGEEPNEETDGEMCMYDYNGHANGGKYYVLRIDMTASW